MPLTRHQLQTYHIIRISHDNYKFASWLCTYRCYAPPSQVGGGGWDQLCLTLQQHALWKGHLPCMGNCYCTFAHLCGPPRRQLGQIPKYAPPPTNLGGWENSDSCIQGSNYVCKCVCVCVFISRKYNTSQWALERKVDTFIYNAGNGEIHTLSLTAPYIPAPSIPLTPTPFLFPLIPPFLLLSSPSAPLPSLSPLPPLFFPLLSPAGHNGDPVQ